MQIKTTIKYHNMSSRMATIKKTRKSKCYLLITSDAMQFYSAVRKNKILAFATWMELEGIMLSEIRQADKYCMVLHMCGNGRSGGGCGQTNRNNEQKSGCQKLGCGRNRDQCVCAQSCPNLCNSMDCSSPGSSVHRISQARMLEWFAISFSRKLNPCLLHLLHWQADFNH